MGLGRRLRSAFLAVAAICGVLIAGLALHVSTLKSRSQRFVGASSSLNLFVDRVASCTGSLMSETDQLIRVFNDSRALAVAENVKRCEGLLEEGMSVEGFRDQVPLFQKAIRDFAANALEVAIRGDVVRRSILRAQNALAVFALPLRKDGQGESVDSFLRLIWLLGEAKATLTVVPEEEVLRLEAKMRRSVMKLRLNPKLKEGIEDGITDLAAATSVWNKLAKSEGVAYGRRRHELISLFTHAMTATSKSYADEIRRSSEQVSVLGYFGVAAFLAAMSAIGLIFRRVFRTTLAGASRLQLLARSVLRGNSGAMAEFALENEAEGVGRRGAEVEDEIAMAYQALVVSLRELLELRGSLEQKVKERGRALEVAQKELVESAKLAALGTMAAGVGHELNNPLQNLYLIFEELKAGRLGEPAKVRLLEQASQQAERMAKIVGQLKRLGRDANQSNEVEVRVADIAANAAVLIDHRLRNSGVKLVTAKDPGLAIRCDSVKLESVFSNLFLNAIDAFEGVGAEREKLIQIRFKWNELGDCICVVEDNAGGIPQEIRHKIFDPFFSTKAPGKGIGLGLSLCYAILQEMGGTLSFETTEGVGTRFYLKIPASRVVKEKAA